MSNSPEIHIVPRKKCNYFFLRFFSVHLPGPIPHTLCKIHRTCVHSLTALLFYYSVTVNYSSRGSLLIPVMLFLSPMLGKGSFKNSLIVLQQRICQHQSWHLFSLQPCSETLGIQVTSDQKNYSCHRLLCVLVVPRFLAAKSK